jgi:protein O-GlcNAc transferase
MPKKNQDVTLLISRAVYLHQTGDLRAADSAYREVLNQFPNALEASHNLGVLFMQAKAPVKDALPLFFKAWVAEPDNLSYTLSYLRALGQAREIATAMVVAKNANWHDLHDPLIDQLLKESTGQSPTSSENFAFTHVRVAQQFMDRKNDDLAVRHLREALALNPKSRSAFARLYNIFRGNRRLIDAEAICRSIVAHRPDFYDGYVFLGSTLSAMGHVDEALRIYKQAIDLQPDAYTARGALLFDSHYLDVIDAAALKKAADDFGEVVARLTGMTYKEWRAAKSTKKNTTIRVGLVSANLSEHPVSFFLQSILQASRNKSIEWYVYSSNDYADATTAALQEHTSRWQSIAKLNDTDAAALVERDEIQILVDLSGHSDGNRLPLFALRPAPVQVSWLGYFATTGIKAIDYILVDEVGVSNDDQRYFSEKLVYLPNTRLCFSPPMNETVVTELPAQTTGHVTFGCFQNASKINDTVIETWAKVLMAVSRSVLRVQTLTLNTEDGRSQLLARLVSQGISADRVVLMGTQDRADYFASHAAVDMILDTFPYQGGTSTCEALWMGVPTVTLRGNTLLSRQGASLLSAAGLNDWIANNTDDYVALAIKKASDIDALATLRRGLRASTLQSPLMDAALFFTSLEKAFHQMWKNFTAAN